MRHLNSGLLMLAVSTAAMASLVAASEAEASSHHVKKHHQRTSHHYRYRTNVGLNDPWTMRAPPVAQQDGNVCPGNARSFDCKIWPPPFDQDPDRKISGSDGGG